MTETESDQPSIFKDTHVTSREKQMVSLFKNGRKSMEEVLNLKEKISEKDQRILMLEKEIREMNGKKGYKGFSVESIHSEDKGVEIGVYVRGGVGEGETQAKTAVFKKRKISAKGYPEFYRD